MIREINYDELYDLYITKNMRRKDVAAYYEITEKQLCHYLAKVGIKKSKSLVSKNAASTTKERYGGIGASIESNKIKMQQTNLKKYGSVSPFGNKDIYNKAQMSNKNNHNDKLAWNTDKQKQTMIKRYGVDSPWKSSSIKTKVKNTMIERYGVENAMQNKSIRAKAFSKFGGISPFCSNTVIDKRNNSLKRKYNVDYAGQVNTLKNIKEFSSSLNLLEYINDFIKKNNRKPHYVDISNDFNVGYTSVIRYIRQYNLDDYIETKFSYFEDIVKAFLENNSIKYKRNDRVEIYPQEIDFYLPEYKIGIEINDIASHNSTIGFFGEPKDKKYHYEKSKTCEEKGIRLIHIWEWEIRDTNKWEKIKQYILNILKPKEKIYARKCILKEVSSKDTNEFLNNYHLQNTCKGQTIRLGLYYKDELVQVMTFGKPRFNKNYEYELLRLCTKSNYIIVGGAKKLFTNFIKTYKPKSVISYCDNSKFNGNVYTDLGFTLNPKIQLNYYWTNGKYTFPRYKTQKHKLSSLLENFDNNLSESTNMINNGFVQVYDSGQSIYNYISDEE